MFVQGVHHLLTHSVHHSTCLALPSLLYSLLTIPSSNYCCCFLDFPPPSTTVTDTHYVRRSPVKYLTSSLLVYFIWFPYIQWITLKMMITFLETECKGLLHILNCLWNPYHLYGTEVRQAYLSLGMIYHSYENHMKFIDSELSSDRITEEWIHELWQPGKGGYNQDNGCKISARDPFTWWLRKP